jgi:hypothetical protein
MSSFLISLRSRILEFFQGIYDHIHHPHKHKHKHIYTDFKNRHVRDCKKKFDSLCLTEEEVGELFSVFELVDLDRSGLITSYHIMTCVVRCDTKNLFIERMLYTLSCGLRFDGFVIAIWDFLTLPKSALGTHNAILL